MTQTFSSGTGFSKSRVIRTQCQLRPQSQERSLRVGRKRHVREEAEFAFASMAMHGRGRQAQTWTQEAYICLLGPAGGRSIPLQISGPRALHAFQD